MNSVQKLIEAVHAAGATLRAETPDLVIGNPDGLSEVLESQLRERKEEVLRHMQDRHLYLHQRLQAHKFRIGVDKLTETVLIVFSESDAEAIRSTASIHKPFGIQLTESQMSQLLGDL